MEKEVIEMEQKIGCQSGSVWLRDDEDESLLYPYIFLGPHSKQLEGFELKVGQGICGWCVENKKSLITNDMSKTSFWNPEADKKTGFVTENIICIPIVSYDYCYGCIQLLNKKGGFTDQDVKIATEIVDYIIDNL